MKLTDTFVILGIWLVPWFKKNKYPLASIAIAVGLSRILDNVDENRKEWLKREIASYRQNSTIFYIQLSCLEFVLSTT
jgi:hypothetical protein